MVAVRAIADVPLFVIGTSPFQNAGRTVVRTYRIDSDCSLLPSRLQRGAIRIKPQSPVLYIPFVPALQANSHCVSVGRSISSSPLNVRNGEPGDFRHAQHHPVKDLAFIYPSGLVVGRSHHPTYALCRNLAHHNRLGAVMVAADTVGDEIGRCVKAHIVLLLESDDQIIRRLIRLPKRQYGAGYGRS